MTATKLEFVQLPTSAVSPCLVPKLPLNAQGYLPYAQLPEYLAEVLGVVEDCNTQLAEIRKLQPTVPQ